MPSKGHMPKAQGPKLPPYKGNLMSKKVEFLKVLDVDSAHGTVVKARIKKRYYAIKFFVSPKAAVNTKEVYGDKPSWSCCEAFDWYFSPFENECRAFGRLKEKNAEYIAIKVHGWVALTAKQIEKKLVASGAKGRGLNGFPDGTLYGIVKDWVNMVPYHDSKQRETYDQMVAVKHFPKMLANLHKLHFLGIVIRDLKPDQYINGVLVDLSLASTVPHPYGPTVSGRESPWQPRWTYKSLAAWDLYSFQCHVIDFWKHNSQIFFQKRRRNGIQKKCNLQAYPVAQAQNASNIRSGRYKPILTYYGEFLAMVRKPNHDPLDFLRRHPKYPRAIASYTGIPPAKVKSMIRAKRRQNDSCCVLM